MDEAIDVVPPVVFDTKLNPAGWEAPHSGDDPCFGVWRFVQLRESKHSETKSARMSAVREDPEPILDKIWSNKLEEAKGAILFVGCKDRARGG